jgi:hypothetical protein
MDEIESLAVVASQIAYLDTKVEGSPSYKVQTLLQSHSSEFRSLDLSNYQVIFATPDMYAIKKDSTSQIIFSIAGTSLRDASDLWNDLMIVFHTTPSRYPLVQDKIEEVMRDHPGYKLLVTGHSLGGTLAELAVVNLEHKYGEDRILGVSLMLGQILSRISLSTGKI